MNNLGIDQMLVAVSRSPLIEAIEQAAGELIGMRILFMLRQPDDIVKLSPDGSEMTLPPFCRILREATAGQRLCATCRALVGFGACYCGLTDYCCHGGVHVVAAAALDAVGQPSRSIVIASSAFAAADRQAGWAAVLKHASSLHPRQRQKLHQAYGKLPLLTPTNLAMAKALVKVAAVAVGEIACRLGASATALPADQSLAETAAAPGFKQRLAAALFVARDRPDVGPAGQHGTVLAELVRELVSRDPGMPFTVGKIAAAAHLSPNHFSTLFRQHTGETFREFLTDRRIARAKLLLRDLSLNIAEIAQRAGFSEAGYFSRRFKERTGLTPRQWRDSL